MTYLVPVLFVFIPLSLLTFLIVCLCLECIFRMRSNYVQISSNSPVRRRFVSNIKILSLKLTSGLKSIDNETKKVISPELHKIHITVSFTLHQIDEQR